MPNNYDQSSTGINIECNVWYDNNMSQMLFTENFERIEDGGYRGTNTYFYNSGMIDSDTITFTLKANKPELLRYAHDNINYVGYYKDYKKPELVEHIMDFIECNLYSYFSEQETFKEYNIEIIPSTPIERIGVRGYSQGDFVYVIYAPELLQEAWGRKDTPSDDEITEPFVNYFYNAPIYGTCLINGEEYPYYECEPKSDYEYDRVRWIDHILEHQSAPDGLTREALQAVIPINPSYD